MTLALETVDPFTKAMGHKRGQSAYDLSVINDKSKVRAKQLCDNIAIGDVNALHDALVEARRYHNSPLGQQLLDELVSALTQQGMDDTHERRQYFFAALGLDSGQGLQVMKLEDDDNQLHLVAARQRHRMGKTTGMIDPIGYEHFSLPVQSHTVCKRSLLTAPAWIAPSARWKTDEICEDCAAHSPLAEPSVKIPKRRESALHKEISQVIQHKLHTELQSIKIDNLLEYARIMSADIATASVQNISDEEKETMLMQLLGGHEYFQMLQRERTRTHNSKATLARWFSHREWSDLLFKCSPLVQTQATLDVALTYFQQSAIEHLHNWLR
jgi:hypothetical protein